MHLMELDTRKVRQPRKRSDKQPHSKAALAQPQGDVEAKRQQRQRNILFGQGRECRVSGQKICMQAILKSGISG